MQQELAMRPGVLSRRRFLPTFAAALGLGMSVGCAGWPPRPAIRHRLGFLAAYPEPSTIGFPTPAQRALFDGLRQLGWVDGESLTVDFRYADFRDERLPGLAAEIVGQAPDVIVATTTTAALAVRDVTRTVPIVVPTMLDPIGSGLVESLAHPGGNVTGLSFVGPVLSGKRLELLKEAIPTVSEVAVLWNAGNPGSMRDFQGTQTAAAELSVRIRSVPLHNRDDFDGAFATLAGQRPDALLVLPENLTGIYGRLIVDFAASHRLPEMYGQRINVTDGGLMAYGPDAVDLYRRAASQVDKLFRGARAADLPVEQPTKFDFIVNLKRAQSLGLTLPQSVLRQATEVIQ
jgi:putative ABC transport system substrate-binding protein